MSQGLIATCNMTYWFYACIHNPVRGGLSITANLYKHNLAPLGATFATA
jgi:hypothetical protein